MTKHNELDPRSEQPRPEPAMDSDDTNDGVTGSEVAESSLPATTISRRRVLKVLAAGAALGTAPSCAPGAENETSAHEALSGFEPIPPSNPLAAGTPTDPDLLNPTVWWEFLMDENEMRFVTALCDLIIPADEGSPAASAVGVPEYINEHLSYPPHADQLARIRGGLTWLNIQATERFNARDFPALTLEQKQSICDPIKFEPDAPEDLKTQARFFDSFRDLVSTGFWTTPEGMADLGYVGNVPLPSFDGPPPEVIAALGLTAEDLD